MPHVQYRPIIFIGLICLGLVVNVISTIKDSLKMSKLRQRHSYTFVGNQFTGLNTILKDSPMVGYYTDASLDNMRAATQFAQAQLILAPTILDLNNTQHEFVILVCSSPNMAIEKIHSLGLQPLKVSPSGIILARNPTRKTLMQGDIPANLKPITNRQRP